MDLEYLETLVKKGLTIDEIAEALNWKGFEELVSKIFIENGWNTKRNFRFKTKSWHEIDIIAKRFGKIILADCKHWGIRYGKKSQFRVAVKKQKERVKEFKKIKTLTEFIIERKTKKYPLIITLFEEDIIKEQGIWLVPISKLNAFLIDFENYIVNYL